MTFKQITRNETRLIGEMALKALTEAFKDSNIQVKPERGTYGDGNCSLKFQFALRREDGTVETREAQDFRQFASMFGLKSEWFGRTFTANGQQFKITGLAIKSRRMPVLAQALRDGRAYKFPADTVARQCGGQQ